MITQDEALVIAYELKKSHTITSRWRVDKRTKDMMDYYNEHRVELTPKHLLTPLKPMSINCHPCIGHAVNAILNFQPHSNDTSNPAQ